MAKRSQGGSLAMGAGIAIILVGGIAFALTQDFKTGHNRLADYGHAVSGDANAEYQQGLQLQQTGMPDAAVKAQDWFEKSAAQGNVKAMLALGDLHNASKTEADGDVAVEWYAKAAKAGNIEATRKLGICYAEGRGRMDPDPEGAMAQFEIAAKAGDVQAERLYGLQLVLRSRYADAEPWLLKAGDKGDIAAAAALGNIYYFDRSGLKNDAKALNWLGKASEGGDSASQLNYSYMYYSGRGVKKDGAEAYKWVDIAGDSDDPNVRPAKDFLVDRISDAEIADGKARADQWRKAHKA